MTNIRLEAEDITLTGYISESRSIASGNAVVSLWNSGNTQGSATTQFTGATATYDVVVGYYDENDGQGQISIEIGIAQDQWTLNQNLGSGGVSNSNKVERTVFTGLEISNGENITITGTAESAEWARVDYVEFIPVGPGTLSLSNASYSVNEDGTQAAVTVARSNGSIGEVSVTLIPSNGTATAPNDYDHTPITVNFADGETEKTVNIPIVDDTQTEGDESINLALSNPTGGATLGTQDTAALTIVDNDNPGTLSLSNASYSVNEDGTQAAVTVARSNGSIGEVSVTLIPSNGTATAPNDYDHTPITVNFADGETEKTVNIPIIDDTQTEGDESINLALSNPTGGATLGTQDTAVLTVVDNEVPPSPFRLEAEDMTITGYISESRSVASGDAVVSLWNSGNTQGSATTQFTGATGTYDVVVGYYDENDGKSPVSVEIGNDTIDSWVLDKNLGHGSVSRRNFVERTIATSLQINNGENITLNGEREAGEWGRFDYIEFIPVTAPDPVSGTLSLSDTTYSINEDGTTTAAVTVTRSDGSDGEVSVTLISSNGTATAPDDYDHTSIVVNFADGETEKTVNIPIVDDTDTETDETINLALSNPTGGAIIGTQHTAVLTIIDNENPTAIDGTEAGEILTGDKQNNYINGFGGDDTLNGAGGDDSLFGGSGNNIYNGNSGNDTVSYANNQTSGVIANLNTGNVSRKFETWSEDFKILPLGDSNTRGFPSGSSIGGYRNELWRSLNGAGYNLDFVGTASSGASDIDKNHEGRGAFTINHLIDNTVTQFQGFNSPSVAKYTTIENTLGTYNPNMVLVLAGTNDILQGDDADTAIADLEELVERMVTAAPDTHVLVASVIPNTSNSTRKAITSEFSGRIESEIVQPKANAGQNVSFVDIFNSPLISSDFTSDGIHLKSSGYDKLAEVWEDAILNTVVAEDTLINVENLIGSDGNDELTGNNGANELTGGAGDDTLTGGAGDDLFVYSKGDGTDVVTDFGFGNDLFGLSGGLTFNELTIQNAGANTIIRVTSTNEVLAVVEGAIANDITSADFTIV